MPVKENKPVLSFDWLQIHCIPDVPKWETYHPFFKVKKMEFGTRHFSLIEELYQDGKRICTVCSKPYSPVLGKMMMLVKFDNWVLYSKDLATWVPWFLAINRLQFKNISRIDLCMDFNKFSNGMLPGMFIKKYFNATCLKMGKADKFKGVASQKGSVHEFESLRFGSLLSEIAYYLYNKTKEMNEVKMKPWIRNLWIKSGLDVSQDVWRLEFSVKSSGKMVVNQDTGEQGLSKDGENLLNSLDILKRNIQELMYFVLLNRYWNFVWNDGQVKKSRMRKLKLLPEKFTNYVLIDSEGLHDSTRSHKIFIKKLEEVNSELRGKHFDLAIAAHDLKVEMINSRGLQHWAEFKGLN